MHAGYSDQADQQVFSFSLVDKEQMGFMMTKMTRRWIKSIIPFFARRTTIARVHHALHQTSEKMHAAYLLFFFTDTTFSFLQPFSSQGSRCAGWRWPELCMLHLRDATQNSQWRHVPDHRHLLRREVYVVRCHPWPRTTTTIITFLSSDEYNTLELSQKS